MEIIAVSINYKKVGIELRENFSIPKDQIESIQKDMLQLKGVLESILVATCHRIEVYAVCTQIHIGKYSLRKYLADYYGLPLEIFDQSIEVFIGQEAMRHCFLLGAGILSKVIGETQILGQMKHSWWIAGEAETTGIILNRLFKQMVMFAKKVHEEIKINEYPSSTAYQVIQLIKDKIPMGVKEKNLIILGAGEMGKLVFKYVKEMPFSKVMWFNRSQEAFDKIDTLKYPQLSLHSLDQLEVFLPQCDILISCVSADYPLIRKEMIGNKSCLMIDMGFPRSIHAHVGHLEHVELFNIDEIIDQIKDNEQKRQEKVGRVLELADKEVLIYQKWVATLGIHSTLERLQIKTDDIFEDTKESLFRKLPQLDEHERIVIEKHLKSIRNQMIKSPIKELKEMSREENSKEKIHLFERIFGILK